MVKEKCPCGPSVPRQMQYSTSDFYLVFTIHDPAQQKLAVSAGIKYYSMIFERASSGHKSRNSFGGVETNLSGWGYFAVVSP